MTSTRPSTPAGWPRALRWVRMVGVLGLSIIALPASAAVRLHFLGFAQSLNTPPQNLSATDLDRADLITFLQSPVAQTALRESAEAFFRNAAASAPALHLEITSPDGANQPEAWEIEMAALATVAFDANDVIVLRENYQQAGIIRHVYVALPLVVVAAQGYQMLYAQPAWLDIGIPAGVSLRDPTAHEILLSALRNIYIRSDWQAYHHKLVTQALASGAQRSAFRSTFGVRLEDISFSEYAASAEHGFGETATTARLLRAGLENYLSRSEVVIPSGIGQIDAETQKELGLVGYGLEVITELDPRVQLPRQNSGRWILPINPPEPDHQIQCVVRSIVAPTKGESPGQFRSGRFALSLSVGLDGTTNLHEITHQKRYNILDRPGITLRPRLIEELISILSEFSVGQAIFYPPSA